MPFRRAHWYLLGLFLLAILAFWPAYLSKFTTSSYEFHAHGITASLWMLLLAAQSWTAGRADRSIHRKLGLVSLVLFPMFLAGGVGIFLGMAQRFVGDASPFYGLFAPRLAWLDFVAVGGMAYFFFQALRLRRKVHPHSRYMLATVFFLIPPIIGRLMPILPPITPAGPHELWKLGIGFQLANALTAALAFWLAVRSGKHGRPFHEAAAFTLVGALLFQFVGGTAIWRSTFAMAADLPAAPLMISVAIAGGFLSYAGWVAGRRTPPQASPLPA